MGGPSASEPVSVDLERSGSGPGFWEILLRRTATQGKVRGLLNSWLAHSMEEDAIGARGTWSREASSSSLHTAPPAAYRM